MILDKARHPIRGHIVGTIATVGSNWERSAISCTKAAHWVDVCVLPGLRREILVGDVEQVRR